MRSGAVEARGSEVACDFSEFVQGVALAGTERAHEIFKAVVQMALDQGFFGLLNRFFHRLQLLRDIETGPSLLQHVHGAAQVPTGFAQAFDDGWMGCMCMRLFHGCFYPPGEVTIIPFFGLKTQLHAMTLLVTCSLRPDGAALGVRWLVLVVILFGAIISSMGSTGSHGLAVIAAALHAAPPSSAESHGHVHEDRGGELVMVNQSAGADHLHHGADHSHDKAHVLPVAWSSAAPQLPRWWGLVPPRIEMVQVSRLDRPPMS